MRFLRHLCAAVALASFTGVARADEAAKPADAPRAGEGAGRPDREAMRQRMLERFDADKDGKLSDEEREKAREFHREQMGERGARGSEGREREGRGRGPEGRGPGGPEGRRWEGRGPDGPGPGGPGGGPRGPRGPEGGSMGPPPAPGRLFKEFDADKNDQLSRDEFEKLMGHLRSFAPGGPRGFRGPGGPGRPDAGPDGRPPRPRGEGEGRPGRRGPRDGERARSAAEEEKKSDSAPAEKTEEQADDKTT